jgi:hypothetical protein
MSQVYTTAAGIIHAQVPLPNDILFSCLALDDAYLHPAGTIEAAEGLQISSTPPVELDDVWVRWLGTIQAEKFRRSGLFVTAQRRIPFFDERVDELDLKARLFHCCLLLEGCAHSAGGLMVGGNTRHGQLHVGPLGAYDPHFRPHYRRFTRVTADRIVAAAAMLPSAEAIYADGEGPFRPYRRLRIGFNSWIFGQRSLHVDHRLH